jgi:GTPase SAR1 family protein
LNSNVSFNDSFLYTRFFEDAFDQLLQTDFDLNSLNTFAQTIFQAQTENQLEKCLNNFHTLTPSTNKFYPRSFLAELIDNYPEESAQLKMKNLQSRYETDEKLQTLMEIPENINSHFNQAFNLLVRSQPLNLFSSPTNGFDAKFWYTISGLETILADQNNIEIAQGDNSEDQLELGQKIEKTIIEERKIFTEIGLKYFQQAFETEETITVEKKPEEVIRDYIQARIKLGLPANKRTKILAHHLK